MSSEASPPEVFERVARRLRAHCGLAFANHNRAELERALTLAPQRFPEARANLAELLDHPLEGPRVLEWLIHEVTIGETYFFRGTEQFQALRATAMPELLQRAVAAGRSGLTAWSAGCATGEEAYSLAIALSDAAPGFAVSVLGTDINRHCLERARAAEYGPWSLRGVCEADRERYFEATPADRFRVRERYRQLVRFAHLNLGGPQFPAANTGTAELDVVFCRNVFIYFDAETVAQVMTRLASCLAPGGYLCCGPCDPLPLAIPGLELVPCAASRVYRRVDAPTSAHPPARARQRRAHPKPRPPPQTRGKRRVAPRPALADRDVSSRRAAECADRGETALAARLANQWLDQEPGSAPACYLLGLLERERGEPERALALFRRATCLDPSHALAHYSMAELLANRGQQAEARRRLRAAQAALGEAAEDEVLPGSSEVTAGWLRRLVAARLATTPDAEVP